MDREDAGDFGLVSGDGRPRLPGGVWRERGVIGADGGRAGAVVQEEPVQARRNGDGKAVCGQQRGLDLKEMDGLVWFRTKTAVCRRQGTRHRTEAGSVKDATARGIDAQESGYERNYGERVGILLV